MDVQWEVIKDWSVSSSPKKGCKSKLVPGDLVSARRLALGKPHLRSVPVHPPNVGGDQPGRTRSHRRSPTAWATHWIFQPKIMCLSGDVETRLRL